MRRAARRLVRAIAFGLLRISRLFERTSRSLAFATFTTTELDALSVAEWEAFGESGPIVGHEPFAWETEFFGQHIRPGDSILVVGAGTGRDVIPLLAKGHAVTALDITPRALAALDERARSRGLSVATVHSSITQAELPDAAFDVVLFSWFCFGYLRGPEERRSALSRSEAALRKGGRILLSYPSRNGEAATPSSTTLIGRVAARFLGGTLTETGDQFNVSGSSARPSVFFSHSFEPKDIEEEVRRLGFRVEFHGQATNAVGILALQRNSEAPNR